jgi:hypothetical protein
MSHQMLMSWNHLTLCLLYYYKLGGMVASHLTQQHSGQLRGHSLNIVINLVDGNGL